MTALTWKCPRCGETLDCGSEPMRVVAVHSGRHSRADQGLPDKLEDPAVIERLAALVAPRVR